MQLGLPGRAARGRCSARSAQRDQVLSLIRQRVSAGLDTAVELRQGEGALPETRQQIEAVDEQIALARHAMAALAACRPTPRHAVAAPATVRAVPVPGVVPADLLGRRADIVAARWRVEAANQRRRRRAGRSSIPNINLTAFAGLSSIGLDRLVQAGSEQWGVGPAIRLPIFDAGRLRANLQRRDADLDAAVEATTAR